MKAFAHPWLAIVFGAFIVAAETCNHFDSLVHREWLSMPWHDWLAGGWLAGAGLSARGRGRPLGLAVAWAFMSSLLVSAFFDHLSDLWMPVSEASSAEVPAGVLLAALAGLTVVAGLALRATFRRT